MKMFFKYKVFSSFQAAVLIILLLAATSPCDSAAQTPDDLLTWQDIHLALERGALCNDYTPAGYFIRTNPPLPTNEEPVDTDFEPASGYGAEEDGDYRLKPESSPHLRKWVIYLEGGGGCTTPKSCNERFIDQHIREKFTTFVNGTLSVDVVGAWQAFQHQPERVVSKLMTSLSAFSGSDQYQGLYRYGSNSTRTYSSWGVKGESLLSTSPDENPDFYQHNHVSIPYCSSDLWLKRTKDYRKALAGNFQFQFNPWYDSDHQFTFRGAAILRSVIRDLFDFHGLSHASEVLLAGSSAGGVGALNHAGWLFEELRLYSGDSVKLFLMLDSSWFIDFRGIITEQFPLEESESLSRSNEIIETCSTNSSRIHVPDRNDGVECVSAPLFLSTGEFTLDVPVFVIFSRYDLYLLVQALASIEEDNTGDVNILGLMRIVSEYSGSMNESLQDVIPKVTNQLSYFVTSCFQHVYLATSSLWGEGTLLGMASVDGAASNNRFQHNITSDIWSSFHLQFQNHTSPAGETTPISIAHAINLWMRAATSEPRKSVRFHDACNGPYCNRECPESVVLGAVYPYWGTSYQIVILVLIVGVAFVGVVVKVGLSVRDLVLSAKQKAFLKRICLRFVDESESALPFCTDSKAIAIACLDLRYSVTVLQSATPSSGRLTGAGSGPAPRNRLVSIALAVASPSVVGEVSHLGEETGQKEETDFVQQRRLGYKNFQEQSFLSIKPKRFTKKTPKKKQILKGITTYFNPGELVAIMGPSGSGKTTFLDLLAGRRRADTYQGEILVNGIAVDEVRDWYITNTGYVLQLATPYYEELTVRENLTLAAQIRLPKTLSLEDKFERVEKVMNETGLTSFASVQVGGSTGSGLSGGQKRRLCVAIQLLNMPSLIFLDEPTSGLDATSSLELLNHLHRVASSNRTVILTIHQPRLEIFHMFHKILLLCQGQIAYHGIPEKVYEVFLEAYKTSSLSRKHNTRMDSLETKNPADMIMDMLQSEEARKSILSYYQNSDEPDAIREAIEEASTTPGELQAKQRVTQESGVFNRLSALEARASKQAKLVQMLYLPLIFLVYSTLLGTVYFQSSNPTFVLSAFGVWSCASGLFMFPAVYTYLFRAIQIFSLELADGIGSPLELVFQTFFRYTTLAFLPIIMGSIVIFLLVIPATEYNFWVLVQLTLFHIALNHTWVSLLVCVIMFRPFFAHRLSPVISAVAGFSGGFFVPPALMPPWYQWLFYINPNYYGFSAMARVVLQNLELDCPHQSPIECYPTSSRYILTYFSLHITNPYQNILVLMIMSVGYLLLAWISVALRHSYLIPRIKKYFQNRKNPPPSKSRQLQQRKAGSQVSYWGSETSEAGSFRYSSKPEEMEEEEGELVSETRQPGTGEFKKVSIAISPEPEDDGKSKRRNRYRKRRDTISHMLQDGEKHRVWKPGNNKKKQSAEKSPDQRQKTLVSRINTYHKKGKGEAKGAAGGRASPLSNIQRRLEQWRKIEEEAMRLNARDQEEAERAVATGRGVGDDGGEKGGVEGGMVGGGGVRRGSNLSQQVMLTIVEEEEEEGEEEIGEEGIEEEEEGIGEEEGEGIGEEEGEEGRGEEGEGEEGKGKEREGKEEVDDASGQEKRETEELEGHQGNHGEGKGDVSDNAKMDSISLLTLSASPSPVHSVSSLAQPHPPSGPTQPHPPSDGSKTQYLESEI